MPLEYVQPDDLLPIEERRQAGHDLRRLVPRGQHATWQPPADRRDPLQILLETSRHRISSLLPIRYGRMQQSPFAFMRGSAAVMAADLATTLNQRHLGAVLRRLPSGEFRLPTPHLTARRYSTSTISTRRCRRRSNGT